MDERVRRELARRAEEADVSLQARARVMAGVGRRRRWVRPVLAASVAVAATVALVAVVTRDAAPPSTATLPGPSPSVSEPAPDGWRSESWQGLTVDVPADWGWSAAPVERGLLCDERPDAPGYVGRPVFLTDACGTYVEGEFPQGERAPYVWLGAELEPGTVDLPGEGWVQETVEAFGTTLTVATGDQSVRARILDSARPTHVCPAELPGVPEPDQSDGAGSVLELEPTALTVCAYRRGAGGVVELTYASELDDAARDAWAALVDEPRSQYRCGSRGPGNEWVVLHFREPAGSGDAEEPFADAVFALGGAVCPRADLGATAYVLTPSMVAPWAVGGIPYVVHGPSGGKGAMLDSFIGPQG